MTIKNYILIFFVGLTAILVVGTLILFSKEPDSYPNGFTRRIMPGSLSAIHELTTNDVPNEIVGNTENTIYFSTRNPGKILSSSLSLDSISIINIPMKIERDVMVAYNLRVDSPILNIYSANYRALIQRNIHDTTIRMHLLKTGIFTKLVPISNTSIAIRGFDSTNFNQVFKKIDKTTGDVLREVDIIGHTNDGDYSTDGMLLYSSEMARIIYVPYYMNGIYCLDSNLNLLYKAKTIDTIYTNKIYTKNTARKGENGSILTTSPIFRINRNATTLNDKLIILSSLKSDNQEDESFLKNSTLDIYSLKDGKYIASVYLPLKNGRKPTCISGKKGILYATFDNYIASYKIQISTDR